MAEGDSLGSLKPIETDAIMASLKTSALRDGEEYVVNGQKIWTSHTQLAEWCFLLVRTNLEAEKHNGISVLLVPLSTPGIEVHPISNVAHEGAFVVDSLHSLLFQ